MGVFSDLKPRNSVPRNGFDLSRRSVFSIKNGQILPVFSQFTLPNSDYKIDVQQLLRTQPLQTAAFTGFSVNYDFVFVPFNQLYSSFNQFIGQRADAYLSLQPSYKKIPTVKLLKVVEFFKYEILYDFVVSSFADSYENAKLAHPEVSYFPYRCLATPLSTISVGVDFIRMLDMMGYCNLLPYFKSLANTFKSTFHDNSWSDLFANEDYGNLQANLQDTFDTNDFEGFEPFDDTAYNIFPLLAYQKVYYEFYRNHYYDNEFVLKYHLVSSIDEEGEYNFFYHRLFNFDDFVSSYVDDFSFVSRILCMFALHYHTYRKDLFTGVLPSLQFGNVSMQVANLKENDVQMKYVLEAKLHNQTSTVDGIRINQDGTLVAPNLAGYNNQPMLEVGFAPEIAISVLESRKADALQRFRERMLRAGQSTKDIFRAHGWEEPSSEPAHEPVFIGSFDGRLDINTVAATAGTEQVELGQLAANGVAVVGGHEINFHSHDFGVILGLMYIVKDSEYNSFGTDRQLCLTEPFDWPYPELQNISLSPVSYRQLNGLDLHIGSVNSGITPYGLNSIIGYLPAFMEYKTAIDKVHGEFCSGEYAVVSKELGFQTYGASFLFSGVFSDWCTPRKDCLVPDDVRFLYQMPDVVDSVFLQAQNDLQETDPFLVNAYFKCLAVEPISVIGLPV